MSLLFPPESFGVLGHEALSASAAADLNLKSFCSYFTRNDAQRDGFLSVLCDLVYDENTIAYRQEVFEDFVKSPELAKSFEDILDKLRNLAYINQIQTHQEEAKLWFMFNRFKELESYVDTILLFDKVLGTAQIQSRGLLAVRENLHALCTDKDFVSLSSVVKSVELDLDQIHSLTLGVNLDASLNPAEVTLLSVNNKNFKEQSFLAGLFKSGPKEDYGGLRSPTPLHPATLDKREHLMYTLYGDIEKLLNPLILDISDKLGRYSHIKTKDILSLIPEIDFYLCGLRLVNILKEKGLAMCRPKVLERSGRVCRMKGVYNLSLAFSAMKRGEDAGTIVANDIDFDDEGRIFILTGPNRGGKTVFTEAVGLAHILFQAGLYIPADSAEISPVDRIFTHFPVQESETVTLGRLGEEAKRINEIFADATEESLILLNESLASTSYSESVVLAEGVIKAMRFLGVRSIYNTHFHEIAERAEALNGSIEGGSRIVSLISRMENGKRSYKIERGEPMGTSYAMDIAGKYGLLFDQLQTVITEKKQWREKIREYGGKA